MAENSKISWTDHTFNPWIGCTKLSPACDHCYAEAWAKRYRKDDLWQGMRQRTSASTWRQPRKWDREAFVRGVRARVFCASLADVFDNQVDPAWRCNLWNLIADTPNLDWLLLTKRPQNISGMLPRSAAGALRDWGDRGYPNVWLGTTAENQTEADRRIPHLLAAPAAIRFLSCEPLLGPIDLTRCGTMKALRSALPDLVDYEERQIHPNSLCGMQVDAIDGARQSTVFYQTPDHMGGFAIRFPRRFPRLDWVIAGGESGPSARPMHPDWVRDLRHQCAAAGVPFHFKQWGEWTPYKVVPGGDLGGEIRAGRVQPVSPLESGETMRVPGVRYMARVGVHRSGALLDGREWREFPVATLQEAA